MSTLYYLSVMTLLYCLFVLQELQSTTTQGWEIPGIRDQGIKHVQEHMSTRCIHTS